MSPIPQTSFLVGTFFAASYSKTALVIFQPMAAQAEVELESRVKDFSCTFIQFGTYDGAMEGN